MSDVTTAIQDALAACEAEILDALNQPQQTASDIELTLAYVNGYRAANGQEPLDALPEDDDDGLYFRGAICPLAKATGAAYVGERAIRANDVDLFCISLPIYARRVVRHFDDVKRAAMISG